MVRKAIINCHMARRLDILSTAWHHN